MNNKTPLPFSPLRTLSMVLCCGAFLFGRLALGAGPGIVPMPVTLESTPGELTLGTNTVLIYSPAEAKGEAEMLAVRLCPVIQHRAQPVESRQAGGSPDKVIGLALDRSLEAALGPEGYRLEVSANGVRIAAATTAGLFYGGQSLCQLLPPEAFVMKRQPGVAWKLSCCRITDRPRFAWRGVMLDCSRTFQSLSYLNQTIDRMATYKLNVLHLHLTDDQGWRIAIKSHPELTQKGARFAAHYNEPEAHQGFYTQEQLRELVSYAARRHVTIVPEVEMPGHSHEVLVCRPELSCVGTVTNDLYPYGKGPEITRDVLCAGNDQTYQFLEEALSEVLELFPSQFIHIGGDEAPKQSWKGCAKCQARMRAEGLKNEEELQSYFVRRMEKYLNAHGRRLLGWSEILQGGLAPNAAVMDWIGGADQATRTGHDAVMVPTKYCYFDYTYSRTSSERAYSFEPCAGLSPEQAKHILGLQAAFWSHIDREPERVDAQLFPRLLALAERGWSPAAVRDWPAFKVRLDGQLPRLRLMGVHYHEESAGQ